MRHRIKPDECVDPALQRNTTRFRISVAPVVILSTNSEAGDFHAFTNAKAFSEQIACGSDDGGRQEIPDRNKKRAIVGITGTMERRSDPSLLISIRS